MNQESLPLMRRLVRAVRSAVVDSERRKSVILVCFNLIMGGISLFMAAVNVLTAKRLLAWATLAFSLACLLNVWLFRTGRRRLPLYLFLAEGMCLCCFFCVSGEPEGFSALWTCFIPSFTLALLGTKRGSFYSGAGFVMVVLLFWTPWGRGLLRYDYASSFLLRFPMLYLAFFAMAFFLETIRAKTQHQLVEAERRYQYLYKHDALTEIYNRYGFNERMDEVFSAREGGPAALLILDLDFFKNVNDTYGHDSGDMVLCFTAGILRRLAGPDSAVCRWGGEEFTVLVWDGRDPEALAERVRREMEESEIRVNGGELHITVSIGVCAARERREVSIAQMVKLADQCLYQAKAAGRNQVRAVSI